MKRSLRIVFGPGCRRSRAHNSLFRLHSTGRGLTALLAMIVCVMAEAQYEGQSRGDASIRLEYQYIETGTFYFQEFTSSTWTTDSHVVLLSGDYALSERWKVYAALPYVQKRFVPDPLDPAGGDPHDPTAYYWTDFDPPNKQFVDDGEYHGGLQDLSLGIMYNAVDGPAWRVSPYVGYAVPATNYPIYAKAAIGLNLWNIPVGVDLNYVPYFSDWHFRGNLAYVFSEKPLGVNVDYWLAFLSAGYWFKPNISVDVFLSTKYVRKGLLLPRDFTDDLTFSNYPDEFGTEQWYNHDRLIAHRILNAGISFDYFINERYQLSGSYFETVWAKQTNEVDTGFSVALTRYFGHD